jgi:uncharacterized protein YkwD
VIKILDKPRLFLFHNKARSERGIRRLDYSPALSKQCKAYAREMANKGALAHDQNIYKDITSIFPACIVYGENIGAAPPVHAQKRLQDAFMASDAHRKNILNPQFTRVGIGLYRQDDVVWCCVRFVRP